MHYYTSLLIMWFHEVLHDIYLAWHLPNVKADYYAVWKPCHLFKYVYSIIFEPSTGDDKSLKWEKSMGLEWEKSMGCTSVYIKNLV
jgi:hypothetical protein